MTAAIAVRAFPYSGVIAEGDSFCIPEAIPYESAVVFANASSNGVESKQVFTDLDVENFPRPAGPGVQATFFVAHGQEF